MYFKTVTAGAILCFQGYAATSIPRFVLICSGQYSKSDKDVFLSQVINGIVVPFFLLQFTPLLPAVASLLAIDSGGRISANDT